MRRLAALVTGLGLVLTSVAVLPSPAKAEGGGTIAFSEPQDAWVYEPGLVNVLLNVTALDPALPLTFSLDGAPLTPTSPVVVPANGTGPVLGTVDLTGVADGAHTLAVAGTDTTPAAVTASISITLAQLPQFQISMGPQACPSLLYPITVTNKGLVSGSVVTVMDGVTSAPYVVGAGASQVIQVQGSRTQARTVVVVDVTRPLQHAAIFQADLTLRCEAPASHAFSGVPGVMVLAPAPTAGHRWLYPWLGTGFGARIDRKTGWNSVDLLTTVGDIGEDLRIAVVGRNTKTGALTRFDAAETSAAAGMTSTVIGVHWQAMNALVGPGDFDGDGHADLLARDTSGNLWLYPGTGTGTFTTRKQIGSGWGGMNAIVGVGDFDGDGHVDVLARAASNGALFLYPGDGKGHWLARKTIGSGWNGLNSLVGVGDFNGDGHPDVIARAVSTGQLLLYPGSGTGGWKTRVVIGSGWQGFSAIV